VCADGELVLVDAMPVASEEEKARSLLPDHWLLRRMICTRGVVDVDIVVDPRPNFGLERARIEDHGKLGIYLETREGLAILRADVPFSPRAEGGLRARARLVAGDVRDVSMVFTAEAPAILPPLGDDAGAAIDRTVRWWRGWSSRATYDGPYRAEVVRSALTLKLLAYAPSGAILAAPTTSLPERLGGDLNWDYRFCWPRDAAFTARALTGLGYVDEADAFVHWLVHTTALTRPRLDPLYDVFGTSPKKERELWHLSGHRGARPVRTGNAAHEQRQLDVYGETIEAAAQLVRATGSLDADTERMLVGFGEHVCKHWSLPDQGIWEKREPPKPHTHSRLLCWAACDRLLQLHARGVIARAPRQELHDACDAIRRDIERNAWSARLQSYVGVAGTDDLDAIALLIPWYGFERADSVRMCATWRAVREGLGAAGGLLYRYASSPAEGAFGLCGFWAAEYLALGGGSLDQARALFEQLLGYGNDVGLFAEEIDPRTGAALGNFPQGFTHVGVLNAALSIEERVRDEEPCDLACAPWHADRPSYLRAPGLEVVP
jgi:GH15 family glucan-1,4-alpha-glucosidase